MPRGDLRAWYSRGWSGGDFTREPLDRYEATEKKRAQWLIEQSLGQKLAEATQRASEKVDSFASSLPALPGGLGARAKIDDGGVANFAKSLPHLPMAGAEKALHGLDMLSQNTLQPVAAVATGTLHAQRKPVLDASGNPTGEFFRDRPGIGDVLPSLKTAFTQNPVKTFQQGKQAEQERFRNPALQRDVAGNIALRAATDPTSYIPGGVVAHALPEGLAASRGARIAGSILGHPGPATVGAVAGAGVGAQIAKSTGASGWVQAVAPIIGGGVGGGLAARKFETPVANLSEQEAKAAGRNWQPPVDSTSAASTLGLDPTRAHTAEEVKAAYRARIRSYHPDVNASDTGTADAQAINAAFSKLANGYAPPRHTPNTGVPPGAGSQAGNTPPPGAGSQAGAPPPPPPHSGAGQAGSAAPPPPSGSGMAGAPPVPPSAGPTPFVGPRRVEDMFNTISRDDRIAEEQKFRGSVRGKVDTAARAVAGKLGADVQQDTELSPFISKEKNRMENLINSHEGRADELWTKLESTGIKVERGADGEWRLPDGTPFGDMAELSTPNGRVAYANLSSAQQEAVDALQTFNEDLNANLRFHGGKRLGWDEFEKAYFPKVATAQDGAERVSFGTGGRKIGTELPYEKQRVYDTLDEGLQNGVSYAHPREAFRAMTRAKLRSAMDDAMISRLQPLGSSAADLQAAGEHAGFGWTQVGDVAPGLNGTFFPAGVAEKIRAAFKPGEMGPLSLLDRANKLLTPIRATADISWAMQQGLPMLYRHPAKAAKATFNVIRSVGNDAHYVKLMEEEAARGPGLKELVTKMGLQVAPGDLGELGVDFKQSAIRKVPIVGPASSSVAAFSNKTFSRYMNYQRVVFANDAYERIGKLGLSGDELRKELQGAGNAVNRMSGFTGRKPTRIESLGSFAPRYLSASVEQLAAAVSKGGMEGALARGQMIRMLAFGGTAVYLVNKAHGEETDFNPTSSNFMRFRNVGGLDVSAFGTYDTLFRVLAKTVVGDPMEDDPIKGRVTALTRFAEGKMSPAVQALYHEAVVKRTFQGKPLDITSDPIGSLVEEGKGSLPFSGQNILEQGIEPAVKERSLKTGLKALPGVVASATGLTNSPMTPSERRERAREGVAQEQFGRSYDDLSGADKSRVNEDAKVADLEKEVSTNKLEGGEAKTEGVRVETQSKIDALSERFKGVEITGSEFRDIYHDIGTSQRAAYEALQANGGGKDKLVDAWFSLYDRAEREDGSLDTDVLDELQSDFQGMHPDIQERVDKVTGTHDNAVMRQFREAQAQNKEYRKLPRYQGMSVEDGERAAPIVTLAARMASNDQARTARAALTKLVSAGEITAEEAALARRAQRAGSSRERRRYATSHPLFAQFYRDAVSDAEVAGVAEIGTVRGGGRRRSDDFSLPSFAADLPKLPKFGVAG